MNELGPRTRTRTRYCTCAHETTIPKQAREPKERNPRTTEQTGRAETKQGMKQELHLCPRKKSRPIARDPTPTSEAHDDDTDIQQVPSASHFGCITAQPRLTNEAHVLTSPQDPSPQSPAQEAPAAARNYHPCTPAIF